MVQRNTHNHICRECGRPAHRGTPANQPRRKRFRLLVRPGEKAKPPMDALRTERRRGRTVGYYA